MRYVGTGTGRRPRAGARGLAATALTIVVALVAAGCSGGRAGLVDAGQAPGRSTTTTATGSDTTGGPDAPGPSGASGGGSGNGSASGGGATTTVALYFTRGELVERVSRSVPKVTRIGAEAVKALLAGPNDAEHRSGLRTAIPAGTQFRDLVIENGVARVDLSSTFESGGGGLGLTLRLAQVACTLDAFPTVSGVRFALDGRLVDVLSGDGVVVDEPVSCDDYAEYVNGDAPPPPAETFAGIWPFATAAELADYAASGERTYRDPSATARDFADRYLGMTDPVVFPFRSVAPGLGEVPVGFRLGEGGQPLPNPQPTTVVQVSQLGDHGDDGPWTVTRAASPDIVVDAPKGMPAPQVSSPVRVSGQARAFEGTVNVEVREDGMTFGQSLGRGIVTGRGDGVLGPFQGDIAFRTPSKPAGAVVFVERNVADGGTPVMRATVVRVAF